MVLRHLQFRSFTSWRQTSYESSSAAVGCTAARCAWLVACSAASQSLKSCDFASELIDSSTQQHSSPSTLLIATCIVQLSNCFQNWQLYASFRHSTSSVVHQTYIKALREVRMHGRGKPPAQVFQTWQQLHPRNKLLTHSTATHYYIKTTSTSEGWLQQHTHTQSDARLAPQSY